MNFLPSISTIDEIIAGHVRGLDFVDVGGLWGVVNEKLTVAHRSGARSICMVDIQDDDDAWNAVRKHCSARGCAGYEEIIDDVTDPMFPLRLGTFGMVYCSGVIYHTPSPLGTICNLATISRRYLLVGSVVVPDRISNQYGTLSFEQGQMSLVAALQGNEKLTIGEFFEQQHIQVPNINGLALPWIERGHPSYTPWWWLYSLDTLVCMIKISGFRPLDIVDIWDGRAYVVFSER